MKKWAYYNEHDPFAAAWIRELMKSGLIMQGEVDERSIEDVRPSDVSGFIRCHWFAGIAVWDYSLRLAGFPEDRECWTGSCPCQPFSTAGKGDGFADERHLWPAFYHLIGQRRPDIVFGEQVASKDADTWIDLVHTDMEALGYAFGAIPFPSAGVGAPHIRDRLYWVADAKGNGHEWRGQFIEQAGRTGTAHGGAIGGLVHPLIEGLEGQPRNGNHRDEPGRIGAEPSGSTAKDGGACGLADTDSIGNARTTGQNTSAESATTGSRIEHRNGNDTISALSNDRAELPGPTNGFWRDADWLGCRDGKWRPVMPGTFPLVTGAPARVGRLRGYGNAINAEAAKAFIESYLEIG